MGQKINPNIFRLEETNDWQSKYFEKKITEDSNYSKKDTEIRNFIDKFFKNQKLTVHCCKLHYLNESIHIFISYHQSHPKHLNKNFYSNYKNFYKINQIRKTIENFNKLNYSTNWEMTNIKKKVTLKKNELKKIKNKWSPTKQKKCLLRKHNYFKNVVPSKQHKRNPKTVFFLKNFFESLTNFTHAKTKILLILQFSKNDVRQIILKKTSEILKKKLTNLRKYQKEEYFKEGINLLFICTKHRKCSKLLAKFISFQLKKLKKQQHRFINFIKHTLTLLKDKIFSKCKGIKIQVKGRMTKATRAKNRTIQIAKNISLFSIKSKVNYAEETAFSPNGTIGIKVWIYES